MECLKVTNYVVIVMDLRISCQYKSFINTSPLVPLQIIIFGSIQAKYLWPQRWITVTEIETQGLPN